ncbi:MAG: hypothetical protein D4R90_05005 [Nitrosopumilales archaeon]|nr:MAG: hypothetical protein D4R90_05005 [Nitrosopumilales archaeon]
MKTKYFAILVVFAILVIPAYADIVVKPTSAGTINVGFTTDPATPNPGDPTQIKLNFINKQTNALQPHVDYKIAVIQGGNQVFGIPITHTAEGAVSIPFQFQTAGTYQVIVDIEGLVFQPIPPETVTFDLNVGSSSNPTSTIQIPKWVKNNAKYWHDGAIDDSTFAQGIQYMIKHGIITIPPTQSGQAKPGVTIPAWVKNNAGYWSTGDIDDATFVKGIQYLITIGIIQV